MITSETKKVYTVNGQEFTRLEEAQASALVEVIVRAGFQGTAQGAADLARTLIPHADEIVDILTTRPGSLARARKINGARKVRKSKLTSPALTPSLALGHETAQKTE